MGFATTLADAVDKLFELYTRTIGKAFEGDPAEPNQDAVDAANRDLREVAAETSKSFSDEAGEQARKRVFKGGEINRFDRWGMKQVQELFDLAEKWRKKIIKAWSPAKVAVSAGAAVGIAAIAAAGAYWSVAPSPNPPPAPDVVSTEAGYVVDIDIPPPLPDIPPPDLTLSGDEFDALVSRLDISSLSLAALGRERADLDVSDLPPVAMPLWVAAAAAAPVEVSMRQGNATSSVTTTVQQLYETVPEARDQIEEHVRDNGGSGLHVDINVGTDFATIRIKS
jgi:hypothetical protein